jgi:hypothetical protein
MVALTVLAGALLQASGAGQPVLKIFAVVFFSEVFFMIYVIRAHKQERSSTTPATDTQSLKKVLLSLALWVVAVCILAIAWANGHADWGLAVLSVWVIIAAGRSVFRSLKSDQVKRGQH